MKNFLVFVGESGSGKTTLIQELVTRYPDRFKKVLACTSRKPRPGEVDGVDYRFCTPEYFINTPDLLLVEKTINGDYYGGRRSDMESDTHTMVVPLRPHAVKRLIDLGCKHMVVVKISITEEMKIQRMRERGDTEQMIQSRLKSDLVEKVEVDLGHTRVLHLSATDTIDESLRRILEVC